MSDLTLVSCFFGMLMIPCFLAVRSVRSKRSPRGLGAGIFAVGESYEEGEGSGLSREAFVDRRALAIQRNREIYFRTAGRLARPEERFRAGRVRVLGAASLNRRAG